MSLNTVANTVKMDPDFGVVAPELGWVPPLRYLLRRHRILALIAYFSPGRLLEIGCGAGTLLVDFSRLGFICSGVETSPRALDMSKAIAQACATGHEVFSAPETHWAAQFDTVCAFDVLEHIEQDEAALKQWLSWIKPGGHLVLSVPAHPSRYGAGDVWAGHYRRYTKAGLRSLLQAVGLRIDHVECYGFPLANLTEFLGERYYRKLLEKRRDSFDQASATAQSGIERSAYLKNFHVMNTWIIRITLRAANFFQWLTRNTELGSGYLIVASRL